MTALFRRRTPEERESARAITRTVDAVHDQATTLLVRAGALHACLECDRADELALEDAATRVRQVRVRCKRCGLATAWCKKARRAVWCWNQNRGLRHVGQAARAAEADANGGHEARQRKLHQREARTIARVIDEASRG